MFTVEERTELRDALIEAARADRRITGIALTGSASRDAEDRWSDIDLAFGVAGEADRESLIADWTEHMYQEGAVHHVDVHRGETVFRVFMLAGTLQVDLAFWPAADFAAIGPSFRLLSGTANPPRPQQPPDAAELIGLGWLYALHVRSSIARGRLWQAEYMLSAMRDQVLALVCLRHGAATVEARGIDSLPPEVTGPLADGLVRSLDPAELRRAFRTVTDSLIAEIDRADSALNNRLRPLLMRVASA